MIAQALCFIKDKITLGTVFIPQKEKIKFSKRKLWLNERENENDQNRYSLEWIDSKSLWRYQSSGSILFLSFYILRSISIAFPICIFNMRERKRLTAWIGKRPWIFFLLFRHWILYFILEPWIGKGSPFKSVLPLHFAILVLENAKTDRRRSA